MKRRKILGALFNISLTNTNDLAEWIRGCITLITYFKVHTNKEANVFAVINNQILKKHLYPSLITHSMSGLFQGQKIKGAR